MSQELETDETVYSADGQEDVMGADHPDAFWAVFQPRYQAIKSLLDSLQDSTDKSETIRRAKTYLQSLQRYSTSSTRVLARYDIRRNLQMLDSINKDIRKAEKKHCPSQSFRFSSSSKVVRVPLSQFAQGSIKGEDLIKTSNNETSARILPPGSYVIEDRVDEEIFLPDNPLIEDKENIHIYIKNLTNCKVILPWVLGSVRIESLQNCQIFLGPCRTSIYLEGVNDSLLFLSSHQLRIHTCISTTIFCLVQSHPIIEDCKDMKFGKFSLFLNLTNLDMQKVGLSEASSWDNVIDFRWHKSTPSPNWRVLTRAEEDEFRSKVPV